MMCPDGNPCDTWFGADGCLICRHGLVASAGNNTSVDFKCPLELLGESEKRKWERFFKEGCKKFLSGEYAGEYESQLIDEFEELLPEVPPWKISQEHP